MNRKTAFVATGCIVITAITIAGIGGLFWAGRSVNRIAETSREVPLEVDEQMVRTEFGVPDDFALVAIDVEPKKWGNMQREGLQIDARFAVPPDRAAAFLADSAWQPLPSPSSTYPFPPSTPSTMKAVETGQARCWKGVFVGPGNDFEDVGCDVEPTGQSHVRVAVYEPGTRVLHVFYKNHY